MKMYQVDAFSTQLFKGNPAAVLVLDEWLEPALMQKIALENNLSETAFVKIVQQDNDTASYEIRWFTPTVEVDFCGHATLASSFVLFEFYTEATTIQFHVRKLGVFTVHRESDGKIRMNFPVRKATRLMQYPALLNDVVDCPIKEVYQNEQAFILVCESETDVIQARPNLANIQAMAEAYAISTAITAADGDGPDVTITADSARYDYVARYFAPHKGINEDPVTGSMHTGLAPLWAEKLGKHQLLAYQASARGGELFCELKPEDHIEISGYARLYMQAEINIQQQ
ncbi:PhzF family phenazine biosynthesis protein [Acinetobacter sp. WZC-1]|uniref:PhzF family phenazine biosynthesis protein n=1 Tax=Acinetobacter sp. WZC-1 TaxID=3459034 RepID=UPI00403D5AE2